MQGYQNKKHSVCSHTLGPQIQSLEFHSVHQIYTLKCIVRIENTPWKFVKWMSEWVCVCARARMRACMHASVVVCLCLYDYRFSRHFPCCKTWWIKNLNLIWMWIMITDFSPRQITECKQCKTFSKLQWRSEVTCSVKCVINQWLKSWTGQLQASPQVVDSEKTPRYQGLAVK